mmetsp:Transcript_37648/g.67159  ORF Transcript_37648/g.67159 Transcript_37648/m.67159 type:complete len:209 (-) Transcript_37648:2370-2996(-)
MSTPANDMIRSDPDSPSISPVWPWNLLRMSVLSGALYPVTMHFSPLCVTWHGSIASISATSTVRRSPNCAVASVYRSRSTPPASAFTITACPSASKDRRPLISLTLEVAFTRVPGKHQYVLLSHRGTAERGADAAECADAAPALIFELRLWVDAWSHSLLAVSIAVPQAGTSNCSESGFQMSSSSWTGVALGMRVILSSKLYMGVSGA